MPRVINNQFLIWYFNLVSHYCCLVLVIPTTEKANLKAKASAMFFLLLFFKSFTTSCCIPSALCHLVLALDLLFCQDHLLFFAPEWSEFFEGTSLLFASAWPLAPPAGVLSAVSTPSLVDSWRVVQLKSLLIGYVDLNSIVVLFFHTSGICYISKSYGHFLLGSHKVFFTRAIVLWSTKVSKYYKFQGLTF